MAIPNPKEKKMKKLELLPPPYYLETLKTRVEELKYAQKMLKSQQPSEETGEIRISEGKYGAQYYFRKNKRDKNGKYLLKSQFKLAKQLVQQNYNKRCLKKVESEIALIEQLVQKMAQGKIAETENGENLVSSRKALVETATLGPNEYAAKWSSISYKAKETWRESALYQTANGEKVRSKSEVMIADTLKRCGIPYRYEYPLHLPKYTVYPDFYCLNLRTRKEYYWEHFGLMDDPDYVAKTMEKLSVYEKGKYFPGSSLIITMETKNWILTPQRIERVIANYLR